jgi:hypothetical protein
MYSKTIQFSVFLHKNSLELPPSACLDTSFWVTLNLIPDMNQLPRMACNAYSSCQDEPDQIIAILYFCSIFFF